MKKWLPCLFWIPFLAACGHQDQSNKSADFQSLGNLANPAERWEALQNEVPFAYTTPLPDSNPTSIDGTYAKVDQTPPQYWKCLRCADYRPAGGIWKLQFERGVMRIYYDVTGWFSLASYTVEGSSLKIFNDPFCPSEVGEYSLNLVNGSLNLISVSDSACAFELRQQNLGNQPWLACSGAETAQAPGCIAPMVPTSGVSEQLPHSVKVTGGDSRFFNRPPEIYTAANSADQEPPDGIQITYHEEAVGYGLHRILWWNGDWIEASTDLPFESMGVQIMGEEQIGWARVLFDGMEVWRGDTSAIWEQYGRHGGYIEVSGYQPGRHVLRVESLNFDYRPVTVAGFGFNRSTFGEEST